jgi:hypothetical protein
MRYQFEGYMKEGDISWRDAPRYIDFKLPYEFFESYKRNYLLEIKKAKLKLEDNYRVWADKYGFDIDNEETWVEADIRMKEDGRGGIQWVLTVIEYFEDIISGYKIKKLEEIKDIFGSVGYDWRAKGVEYNEAEAKARELGYWRNLLKDHERLGEIVKVDTLNKEDIKVKKYYEELEILKGEVNSRLGNTDLIKKIEANKNKLKLRLSTTN